MSALPVERIDVRCPSCHAKQMVVIAPGSGLIEIKCWRKTCRAVFTVDVATGKPCQHKVLRDISDR